MSFSKCLYLSNCNLISNSTKFDIKLWNKNVIPPVKQAINATVCPSIWMRDSHCSTTMITWLIRFLEINKQRIIELWQKWCLMLLLERLLRIVCFNYFDRNLVLFIYPVVFILPHARPLLGGKHGPIRSFASFLFCFFFFRFCDNRHEEKKSKISAFYSRHRLLA